MYLNDRWCRLISSLATFTLILLLCPLYEANKNGQGQHDGSASEDQNDPQFSPTTSLAHSIHPPIHRYGVLLPQLNLGGATFAIQSNGHMTGTDYEQLANQNGDQMPGREYIQLIGQSVN